MAFLRPREEKKAEAPRAVLSDISNKPLPDISTAKEAVSQKSHQYYHKNYHKNIKKRKLNPLSGTEPKKSKNVKSDNVLEYADDIYTELKSKEKLCRPSTTYFERQPVLNPKMRVILFDWLVEVHLKFKLKPATLFLTLDLVDKYLDVETVSRSKLQLVGCTAMLLASKYEEVYAPEVRDFVYISDNAYKRDEIIKMETIMLVKVKYRLSLPTCYHFSERYSSVCEVGPLIMNLCYYYMETVLMDLNSLKYLPSQIAAGSLLAAVRSENSGNFAKTRKFIEARCGYTCDELQEFTSLLKGVVLNPDERAKSVRKKYSSSRFGCVGKISRRVLMGD